MQPITVPSDANAFPPELLETPQPVIGFVGLDCSRNLTHKSIWDAFNTNRKSDRAAIQFKLLTQNYDLPVVKPKRPSYEWYHPKGILKRNWILKHLHVLPAVIVLIQDLEWNDPLWTEKQYQCVSTMQTIKTSIQGRHTKLAIVLLQKNTGTGDDSLAGERLSTLATKCDINQKFIFVLPYNDNLMGYTLRLESAFLEQAQSYYLQSSKQVRMHRDQLTPSHQELKIRHQFKLGFYAEMRMDLNTAVKHFDQAYEWLEEIRVVDTNCSEIKVVAGFLNYKICKLMFNVGSPREAITQFRTHIDRYRNRSGTKDLLFEHFAWLSVQYNAFADLFCDAIKLGLPALQTQHPGIYYHKSAEYMSKRKDTFQQLCQVSSPLIDFLPFADQNVMNYSNILYSDFFGVRGNRTTEPVNEQQIIAIVQECEKFFNHSAAYISLLGQAMAQFKIYKCPRFRKKLAIDMAEEYLRIGDASKALTLYSLMLAEYRTEKWNNIFTQVLLKTLRSAFLSASVPDFIICSIECLSSRILIKRPERISILENLWKVFQKVPPIAQSQIVPELHMNWEKSLNTFNAELTFDLDKITKLFDCNVTFEKSEIYRDDVARVNLFIKSVSDVPIKVHTFNIVISNAKTVYKLNAYQWKEIGDNDIGDPTINAYDFQQDFMLQPNILYQILFVAEQCQFSENSTLNVVRLEIKMGTADNSVTLLQSSSLNVKSHFSTYNHETEKLNKAINCSTCYIIPLFHLKTSTLLSHQFMLTNEYFGITIQISNDFDMLFENVSLLITVPAHLRNKVFIVPDLSKSRQKLLAQFEMMVGNLDPNATKTIHLNVISLIDGTLELEQLVRYQIANGREKFTAESMENETNRQSTGIQKANHNVTLEYIDDAIVKSKKDTIIISCAPEFTFSGKFFSLNKEPLQKAIRYEDFLFQVELDIKTTDIEILDIFLISDYNITEKPYKKNRRKFGRLYLKGEQLCDIRLLHAEQSTMEWVERKEFQERKIQRPFRKMPVPKLVESVNTKTIGDSVQPKNPPTPNIMETSLNSSSDDLKSQTIPLNTTNLITQDYEIDTNKTDGIIHEPKAIFNHTVDAFSMIENSKGFLCANVLNSHSVSSTINQNRQIIGIYCVRWRRAGEKYENETKLMVNSIEIIEAPVNLYCYMDEKMYVKVPMTLTITLRNSTNSTIHLKSQLKNADNFMFAGHSQFNISLFAQSTYNLEFNLYPLKAGWQNLPEFIMKYNTREDVPGNRQDDHSNNLELQKLVERWMPKKVFILPMVKQV